MIFASCAYLSAVLKAMQNLLVLALTLLAFGCQTAGGPAVSTKGVCNEIIDNDFARFFAVQICGGDTVMHLLNPEAPSDTLQTVRLADLNADVRIAAVSTTHIPFLVATASAQTLVGVGYPDYIRNEAIRQAVESGKVRSITGGGKLNFEVIIDTQPDLLLTYPYAAENYDRYEAAGIRVLSISEYAEHHPLGRAEWVKVFGLLTGNYDRSVQVFERIKKQYLHWKTLSALRSYSPLVFTGSFFKGRWSAPGGDSFVAAFINDAGGRYSFAEHPGNANIELDFEVVLEKIAEADFFGKVLHTEQTVDRKALITDNERFELLDGFDDRHLFYCNTQATDYFGKGVLEPHLVLRDLHQIFHGVKGDSLAFEYFQPIAP